MVASQVARQVQCTGCNLVHGRPVVSPKGVVVPLVNWDEGSVVAFNVSLTGAGAKAGLKASLASGGAVSVLAPGLFHIARLEVADALVLRP